MLEHNCFFNPLDEIDVLKGNLPHWCQENSWYFVTFRLFDSLPKDKILQLKHDRIIWHQRHAANSKELFSSKALDEYHRLFSERIEDWMNNGFGSCLLQDELNASIMAECLKFFDGKRYELGEWVIMPNHIHVLVNPSVGFELKDILHSWKSFSANEINQRMGLKGQLWMRESYDHIVRNESSLIMFQKYIRKNPVKAGLCLSENAKSWL